MLVWFDSCEEHDRDIDLLKAWLILAWRLLNVLWPNRRMDYIHEMAN